MSYTVEEVLKGLEVCTNETFICKDCPFFEDERCQATLAVEAKEAIKQLLNGGKSNE